MSRNTFDMSELNFMLNSDDDDFLSKLSVDPPRSQRFHHHCDFNAIEKMVKESKPKNTKKQELWAINIWKSWANERNSDSYHDVQKPIPVILDQHLNINKFLY